MQSRYRLISLLNVSKASPKWAWVLVWLLCAVTLGAFLDNRPDPPSTKPSLTAAASASISPLSFAHPDCIEHFSISGVAQAIHRIGFQDLLTAVEYSVTQRAVVKRASDSSPPSAI